MQKTVSGLNPENFQGIVQEKRVSLYILKNSNGAEVCITNFGSIVVSFIVNDKNGRPTNIVLGQPTLKHYTENPTRFLGATVGRYCDRIGRAEFFLDGKKYELPKNDGYSNLHSGDLTGFHNRVFDVIQYKSNYLHLLHTSPDGENGFPGNLTVNIYWTLTDENELILHTYATTDKPTVCSITNHSFFNLNGGNCTALDSTLQLNCNYFLPIDDKFVPTGEIRPVTNSNFDFTSPTVINKRIDDPNDEQLKYANGYDHAFIINSRQYGILSRAAVAHSEKTGITLELSTTLPCIQFYSGNFCDGGEGTQKGTKNEKRFAFCLEAQNLPDAPNKAHFPSCILRPGEFYDHKIIFKAFALNC